MGEMVNERPFLREYSGVDTLSTQVNLIGIVFTYAGYTYVAGEYD